MQTLFMSILKGASGTGKGTRVSQLIEYLKTLEIPVHFYSTLKPKNSFGLFFPINGMLFIGVNVVSNKSGLSSWSGMDSIHASIKKAEIGREVIKEAITLLKTSKASSLCIVIEGEPMFLSDKFRPEFIEKEYSPDRLLMSYFMYEDRKQYDSRIMGRSGKPSGDSGWSRVSGYQGDFDRSVSESQTLDSTQCSISMRKFDETYWRWGADTLRSLGMDETNFCSWSEANPMLRTIGGSNPLSKSKKLW